MKTGSARGEHVLTGLTIVMTLIAVVFAGAWVWRVVVPHPAPDPLAPIHVANWRRFESTSIAAGSATAPVAVTVFSDYQCPFCRKTEADLRSLERQHPGLLYVNIRHFPLGIHPHAFVAAEAAVCADQQHAFAPMHELMFTEQDSLGTRKWRDFAAEAGVPNVARFIDCLASPITTSLVARDTLLGNEIGVRGTPTILVNDVMIGGYPGMSALQRYVTAAAQSRSNLAGY